MADMYSKGRNFIPAGALHPRAKLSAEDVQEIRRRRAAGESGTALAKEFRVHHVTVYHIASGKSWKETAQ